MFVLANDLTACADVLALWVNRSLEPIDSTGEMLRRIAGRAVDNECAKLRSELWDGRPADYGSCGITGAGKLQNVEWILHMVVPENFLSLEPSFQKTVSRAVMWDVRDIWMPIIAPTDICSTSQAAAAFVRFWKSINAMEWGEIKLRVNQKEAYTALTNGIKRGNIAE